MTWQALGLTFILLWLAAGVGFVGWMLWSLGWHLWDSRNDHLIDRRKLDHGRAAGQFYAPRDWK